MCAKLYDVGRVQCLHLQLASSHNKKINQIQFAYWALRKLISERLQMIFESLHFIDSFNTLLHESIFFFGERKPKFQMNGTYDQTSVVRANVCLLFRLL